MEKGQKGKHYKKHLGLEKIGLPTPDFRFGRKRQVLLL